MPSENHEQKKSQERSAHKEDRPPEPAAEEAATGEKGGGETSEPEALDRPVIVGIGASAGGLEAFREFLKNMPADTNMAFVLIPHLDPERESMMAELLSKHTSMPVMEVDDGGVVEAGQVYMISPNRYFTISEGKLRLTEPVKERGMRMPIDAFFRSLAKDQGRKAIGVILSGAGSDGTLGLRAIKEAGGMVMVEDPELARYDGMPRNAIATGLVDYVISVPEMPEVLQKYVKHPYVDGSGRSRREGLVSRTDFQSILSILHSRTSYDFRAYKQGTIARRIDRRMGLHHISSPEQYVELLRQDPTEVRALFKDLLIGVTAFFRDPETFDDLNERVIQKLVHEHRPGSEPPIRVWVPGCTTGEEVYSVAILFYEAFTAENKPVELQVFATDIDEDAIETARAGRYPRSIAADLSNRRLERFFSEEGEHFRVSKKLRESVVFAVQNLIGDPPFSNLDLICCRNLLIYLDAEVQKRVLQLFHFALHEGGHLFLGPSESVGQQTQLFAPVSKSSRIFQKIGKNENHYPTFPVSVLEAQPPPRNRGIPKLGKAQPEGVAELARRALMQRFVPASVIINRDYEVLFFHGPTRQYLDYPSGEPTLVLTEICLEGLTSKIRAAVKRALSEDRRVTAVAQRVQRNGSPVAVEVRAETVEDRRRDRNLVLVSFQDVEVAPRSDRERRPAAEGEGDDEEKLVAQLEYELQVTREELETSNEELKASNEEVMSMNEEFQSTNEELETSREELQSLNEELTTVNAQLNDKVDELETINNDLKNLLNSTDIAVIFLDTDLRIRRYTPAMTDLVSLIPSDEGRPFTDIVPRFTDDDLLADARQVLDRLAPIEKEVHDGRGRWYIRRVLPYRTGDNRINGVVITFTDITELREAADRVKLRERQQAAVAELGREALADPAADSFLERAAQRITEILGVELCEVLELRSDERSFLLRAGVGWRPERVGGAVVEAGLKSHAGYTLEIGSPVISQDLRDEKRFTRSKLLEEHDARSGLSVIIGETERPYGVLGAFSTEATKFNMDDVNFLQAMASLIWETLERTRIGQSLRESEQRLQLALEGAEMGSWEWNPATDESVWDDQMYRLLGLDRETNTTTGERFLSLIHPEDADRVQEAVERCQREGEPYRKEFRIRRSDGEVRWLAGFGEMFREPSTNRSHMFGVNFDITEIKEQQRALARLNETLERRVAQRTALAERRAIKLREMALEVTAAGQRERQRLARLVHDELQQMLVGARMKLERARRKLVGQEEIEERLAPALDLINQSIHASRTLAVELQPPVLSYPGLVEALEWLIRRTSSQHDLTVDFEVRGEAVPIEENLRLMLFDVLRELLLNVAKHAGVDSAKVTVEFGDDQVCLGVRDEGDGFDLARLEAVPGEEGRGIGLFSIKERLELLGGTLEIESIEGQGALFHVQVPISRVTPVPQLEDEEDWTERSAQIRLSAECGVIRVLVADDHKIVREGLVHILEQHPDVVVVGEASDGDEAIRMAAELAPDVVVMDVNMPGTNGIDATRKIKRRRGKTVVVGLSLHGEPEVRSLMIDAGAAAFVNKELPSETLLEAILDVYQPPPR